MAVVIKEQEVWNFAFKKKPQWKFKKSTKKVNEDCLTKFQRRHLDWKFVNSHRKKKIYSCEFVTGFKKSDKKYLTKVILDEANWYYGYDLETKQQSNHWTPVLYQTKKRQGRSNVQTVIIVVYHIRQVVLRVFVPPGGSVNQYFCLGVLRHLREYARRKRPYSGDWVTGSFFKKTSLYTRSYLWTFIWFFRSGLLFPILRNCQTSCDFFIFPRFTKNLIKKRFDCDVKTASQRAVDDVKVQEFQSCIKLWVKWLDKCIASNEEYFKWRTPLKSKYS